MSRQGRIQSGTGVYHVMMRGIKHHNPVKAGKLTALIDAPLDNDVSCIEYEEERERSISDDSVMLCLKDEFGITDGQQVQKLCKDERDVILAALLIRHAGVRQLQRLTGIGKNIISNVSKKYISRQDSDLSPVLLKYGIFLNIYSPRAHWSANPWLWGNINSADPNY